MRARLTTILLATLLVACSDSSATKPLPGPVPPAPVAVVEIGQAQYSLYVGATAMAAVSVKDAGGRTLLDRTVTWISDALHVAAVAPDGRIIAVGAGTARIIASAEGKSDTSTVTVQLPQPPDSTVAIVALGDTVLALETQDGALISATAKNAAGEVLPGRLVTWATSNGVVATVSANGVVDAKSPGTAIITATSGGIAATARVSVVSRPTSDIVFQRSVPDTNQIYTLNLTQPGALPVYVNAGSVSFRPTASPGGTRIAFAVHMAGLNGASPVDDIYIVDRLTGANIKRVTLSDGADEYPAFAPDNSGRIAFMHQDPTSGRQDIWVTFSDGSGQYALTGASPANETRSAPAWSPDAEWIAYSVTGPVAAADRGSIWIMKADGTGKRRLTASAGFDTSPTWSPDGKRIAFSRAGDINIVDVATGAVTTLALPGTQISPAWSPDGNHFVFSMRDPLNQFGNFHIYTVRADGTDLRVRVRDVSAPFANAVSPSWIR